MIRRKILSAVVATAASVPGFPAVAVAADSGVAAAREYKIVAAVSSSTNVLTAAPEGSGFVPDVFLTDVSLARQKWRIISVSGAAGNVFIENVGRPGECLSVISGGVSIYTLPCNGSRAQQWKVPAVGAGSPQPVVSAQKNEALTRLGGSPQFSPIAIHAPYTGATEQLFSIVASAS